MGYQPIWDCEFDIVFNLDGLPRGQKYVEMLEAIFRHKLMLMNFVNVGPSGHPRIIIRGTRRQILGWQRDYYLEVDDHRTDEEIWQDVVDCGVTCVA